jgi:hypothetical protein
MSPMVNDNVVPFISITVNSKIVYWVIYRVPKDTYDGRFREDTVTVQVHSGSLIYIIFIYT